MSTRTEDQIKRLLQCIESLSPESLPSLAAFYSDDVYFKDPFNEVRGPPALLHIFSHMFETLEQPRFVVTSRIADDQQCVVSWDFKFRFKQRQVSALQTIRGVSVLRFNDAGLVDYHRDYWDAAEELYEKLPLLGSLMRWLKKRVQA